MATTRRSAGRTRCARARGGGFEIGCRVEAGGDGLFQFGGGRLRCLCLFRGLGRGGLPIAVGRDIDHIAIGQFEGCQAARGGHHLVALEQALAFEHLPLETVEGNNEYLAHKTFNDSDEIAHA